MTKTRIALLALAIGCAGCGRKPPEAAPAISIIYHDADGKVLHAECADDFSGVHWLARTDGVCYEADRPKGQ